jgi:hypothetical protein
MQCRTAVRGAHLPSKQAVVALMHQRRPGRPEATLVVAQQARLLLQQLLLLLLRMPG